MADNSKQDVIARQWEMLKLLPTRGTGSSAGQLTQSLIDLGYAVDKRTVERDLRKLTTLFPIVVDERSKPFGWRWAKHARVDMPGMDVGEALSLALIEQYLKPALPATMVRVLTGRFRQAVDKLAALGSSNRSSRWLQKIKVVAPALHLLPPAIPDGVLETVQEALLEDEQIEVAYRSADDEAHKSLRLHPLGIVLRGQSTYLVATAFEYTDPRLLALHRMKSVERLGVPAKRPRGFDLDAYVESGAMEFGDGTPIQLVARVSSQLARHLAETPLSRDMTLQAMGDDFKVTATVRHTWQLHWWILSQADDIEILKPAALRKEVGTTLLDASKRYAKAPAPSRKKSMTRKDRP